MATAKKQQVLVEHSTDLAMKAVGRWAEVSQKALGDMMTLAASTATEGVRLYAEFQASALQAAKAGQAYWLCRLADLQDLQERTV